MRACTPPKMGSSKLNIRGYATNYLKIFFNSTFATEGNKHTEILQLLLSCESHKKPRFRVQISRFFSCLGMSRVAAGMVLKWFNHKIRRVSFIDTISHLSIPLKKTMKVNFADFKSRQSLRCSTAHAEWLVQEDWTTLNIMSCRFGRQQRGEFWKTQKDTSLARLNTMEI